jgi:hypothetical protein
MQYLPIILCLLILTVKAQSVEVNLIEIQIVNDSLRTFSGNPEVTLSLRCKNNSSKNLLLYGFDSNLITIPADRLCTNDRIGGGISVVIFNEKHERVYAVHRIPDSIDYKPIPKERFEQLMEEGRVRYLAGTKVLKGADITYTDRKLDLHEFPLRKGTYYLQIIVFAGKSLMTKRVGEEQIAKDKKIYNAELYQGCAVSNEITFRVD